MKKEIKFNKLRYNSEVENMISGADNINELVELITKGLNLTPLTNKLAENIKENPLDVFKAHVENSIPENLRNASFTFKLEYLGLTQYYNIVTDFYENRMATWLKYSYSVKEGKFYISEDIKKKIRETHTIYIENELDLKRFEYFESLKNILNKGYEEGMLNVYTRPNTIRGIREFLLEVPENKRDYEITINPYTIKNE
jgi:hypothetical protein